MYKTKERSHKRSKAAQRRLCWLLALKDLAEAMSWRGCCMACVLISTENEKSSFRHSRRDHHLRVYLALWAWKALRALGLCIFAHCMGSRAVRS